MPAHITHEVFASEVLKLAFGVTELTPFHVFGAQGADFFLHNHRTKPTGLIFGKLLHSEGYGRFVAQLIAYATAREIPFDSPLGEFTAAFATHAPLDRITHPFINYFSGWVTPSDPQSERYRNCHAFFERILDVLVLRMRTGISIEGYDFLSHADCGESMPEILTDSLTGALVKTYPDYSDREKVRRQVENAYLDTRRYFSFTNPPHREEVRANYIRDHGNTNPPGRFLALLHPEKLPELDYLNLNHREWNNPGDPEERHTESFFDLYEAAVETAVPIVRAVADGFRGTATEDVAKLVGNENLSDGRQKKLMRKLKNVNPLPLQEVLHAIYAQ